MAAYSPNPRGTWNEPEEEQKWRRVELQWSEAHYQDTKVSIANRKPQIPGVPAYNVLVVGCIQAGKSSSIGTFISAMRGDVGQYAAAGFDDQSVTRKLKKFKLRQSGSLTDPALSVNFWDTMGFEESVPPAPPAGPTMRDMEYIMEGHIMDGYEFNPNEAISFYSEHFKKEPSPADKMHVLVVVVSALSLAAMHIDVQIKLKQVIQIARDKDIRVALLLTKCDSACSQVEADLCRVFRSRSILSRVIDAEGKLGINPSCIYAIRNNWNNVAPDLHANILALDSLQHILKLADITLESQNVDLLSEQPPQERPLLDNPSRGFQFSKEDLDTIWTGLADVVVQCVKTLNLCLFGPAGCGKSAFVNTVLTEFKQRIITKAFMGAHESTSPTTTNFRKYPVHLGSDGEKLAMTLCDTMGLTATANVGLHQADVDTILDGYIKDKTDFNCLHPYSVPRGCSKPPLDDQMHLAIITVDGAKIDEYDHSLLQQEKEIVSQAQKKSIPACVLVTNMDRVSEHVRKDTANLYRSQEATECLEKVAKIFNIPMARVLPVVNLHNDTEIDWKKSLLIVHALNTMTECAMEFVKDQDRLGDDHPGLLGAVKGMLV